MVITGFSKNKNKYSNGLPFFAIKYLCEIAKFFGIISPNIRITNVAKKTERTILNDSRIIKMLETASIEREKPILTNVLAKSIPTNDALIFHLY